MTFVTPWALLGVCLAPLVWWLARRRRHRHEVRVPHLPVLESILVPRDLTPVAPPWQAVLLAIACALGAVAAADPRPMASAPRRVVLLAHGDATAEVRRRATELAADDVQLAQVRPAGLDALTERDRSVDHRRPDPIAARRAAREAAGPDGFVVEIGNPAEPADAEPPDERALPPRPAIVVTARAQLPVPRWLVAALAAMPDLVSRAGQVDRKDLEFALRQMPDAFVVGIELGPAALRDADSICIAPPGDRLLALRPQEPGTAVGLRFGGQHPIGRGLSAAGIELDAHRAPEADARFVPLLVTDRGIGAVAGAPTADSRCVAILGDPGRAFSRYPAWPRLLRRSVAWLAAEREQRTHPRQRAGAAELPAGEAEALQLPTWRGQTRGAVRLPPGERALSDGRTLRLEADPFLAATGVPEPPVPIPPPQPRPADHGPAPWLAGLALLALVIATTSPRSSGAPTPGNQAPGGAVS